MKAILILFLTLTLTWPANAQNDVTHYAQDCATTSNQSESFCKCALTIYSGVMREGRMREVEKLKKGYEAYTTIFMNDPAMTKEKIDAACDIHDQALEYDDKATLEIYENMPEEYERLKSKKQEILDKKRELVESYNASDQTAIMLIKGNYCGDRNKIRRFSQDIDFDEGTGIYPEIHQLIEKNKMDVYYQVIQMGQKSGCE